MPARRLRRVLFRSLAALVTLAVVLAALMITKWPLGFMAEKGWLPDEPPCVVCGDLPQAADELGFIAHAAGEIEGRIYTNSLEAIEQAIAAGYRFIEVDLRKTLDNSYYGAHRTKDFNAETDHDFWGVVPPTAAEVHTRTLDGGLTPVLLTDLVPIFRAHPDVMLVTDKATDFMKLVEEFPLKDQLLVEVGDANQYAAAKLVGISNVAVNTETPEAARRHGFEMVVVRAKMPEARMREMRATGARLLIASFEDCAEIPEHVRELASLVYVDRCAKPKGY